MIDRIPFHRKRRTRQHVVAARSVNHVESLIVDEGHVPQRQENDYGYDLFSIAYDERGYVEPVEGRSGIPRPFEDECQIVGS